MKTNFSLLVVVLSATFFFNSFYSYAQPPDEYYSDYNQTVDFDEFYDQLSPYGTWVNIPPYGQVWIANVPNFQPYSTNGYWTYTDYGWTWVSNYPWGWAPFHYGRWGHDNRYGWYWVPGYEWGPAWVAWSSSSDMYGWAPLMPGMHYGVSLSLNLFPASHWTFMHGRYMGVNNISNYYINRSRNVTIIRNTVIINNYGSERNRRYYMGPRAVDVQRYTGRTIRPIRITNVSDRSRAGIGNNELRIYRPSARPYNPSYNSRSGNYQTRNRSQSQNVRPSQPQQNRPQSQNVRPPRNQQQNRPQSQNVRPSQPQQNRPQSQNVRPSQPQQNRQQSQNVKPSQPQQNRSQPQNVKPQQNQQQNRSQSQNVRPQQNQQQSRSQSQSTQQSTRREVTQSTQKSSSSQSNVRNSTSSSQTSKQSQSVQQDNRRSNQQQNRSSSTQSRSDSQRRR